MEISTLHPLLGHEAIHPVRTVVNPTSPTWESVTPSHEDHSEPYLPYLESFTPSSTSSLGAKLSSLYSKRLYYIFLIKTLA